MSVATPPRPTGGTDSIAGMHDKGDMVDFWRSALEHIARGIVAHHEVARHTRVSEIHSSRTKQTLRTDQAAQDASAKAAPHKEIFESCIHALAKLSPPGLMKPAPANYPSLDTRVTALENRTEKLFTTFQSLETQHGAFCEDLSLIEAAARSSEETATDAITRGDKSLAALEERITSLSSRIDAGPSPGALAATTREREQFNARIGSLDDAFRGYMKSSDAGFNDFKNRMSQLEKRAEEWEKLRPKINEHSDKLAIAEGKLNELRQNAEDSHRRLGTLLPLVSEVKALSLVPARITRTEEGIENMKKDHRDVKGQFSSMRATVESMERRVLYSCNQGLATITTEVAVLEPLKRHVNALAALPNAVGQLQKNMLELAPLQAQSEGLLKVTARASDIISSISDKQRIEDSIAELRSQLSRCNEFNENAANAQKDILEVIELTSERVTTLSSQSQIVQEDLIQMKALVTQLECGTASALAESRAASAKIGAIDAKTMAGNLTAEWLKKQLETMREQMAYIEPLGARVEALMLLSGQTEALMPLAAQFGLMSREIQRLWEESEATEAAMASSERSTEVFKLNEPRFQDRLDKLAEDLTTASEDSKQRLGQMETNVAQLESDTSSALGKLSELHGITSAAAVHAKEDQQVLEKVQTEIASLAPLKGHVYNLVSLSRQSIPLSSIVQDFQDFKRQYISDSASLTSQIKVMDVALIEMVRPLKEQASESSQKIGSLSSRCEQLQSRLESIEKVETRVANTEHDNKQLHAKLAEQKKAPVAVKESDTKGQAAVVAGMQRKAKKLVEELQPLRDHLQSLEALSGKAEELMSLVQKVQTVEDNCALACKKSNKRLEEFKDTVYSLDQLVTGCTSKADANQLALDLLEREFKITKDVDESKHKEVEAALKGLAPLQERSERLLALANTSIPAPASAVRVTELERLLKSLEKEMTNVARALLWMDPDVRVLKAQVSQFKTLDSRLKHLSESTKKTIDTLLPLGDCVPALLALLDKPTIQVSSPTQANKLTSEQKKALVDISNRVDALEEGIQGLRMVEPKDLKRISTELETVTEVVDELLVPFMDKAKPLLSLAPLVDHVQSFPLLIDQVAQLQALTKTLSERVAATVTVEPGPASQLRSPLSERDISRPATPSNMTPLFSPPVEDDHKPENSLKRKREMRAMFESLEDQIDGVRAEVEGVADEVRHLTEEGTKFKRRKTSETPVQVAIPQIPDNVHKIEQDLDCVMDTVTKLWTGKDEWPERLDLMLGQQWASVLGVELEGAGSAVLALRADIEVLKLAIEARGSGCPVSTAPVVHASHIAGMEVLAEQVMENVVKQQDEFREQLEAQLHKVLRPIKNMYKALQSGEFD